MEQTFVHMAHFAGWTILVIFILAFIGLISIIRWIVGLFHKTEAAVEGGVHRVEETFHR